MALSHPLCLSASFTLPLISSKIPVIPQYLSLPKGWDCIALYILFFTINSTLIIYDLRFVQVESGQAGVALIDIEMRATASDKEFHLAEQNFRFSFNEDAVFPYAPHHLNGSARNFISYNVELVGGEGLKITTDEWTKIGRLAFQLKSPDAQLTLTWQKRNDKLTRINEGNVEDFTSMVVDIDDPIAVSDALHVFPNPATTGTDVNLTMNSENTRGAGQIVISDALGRTINTQVITVEQGVQNYNVDVKDLSAGTYRVHIQTAKWQSVSQPLVVIEK